MVEAKSIITCQTPIAHTPLVVAVPHLGTYHVHSGIGRVLDSLATNWGERVCLVNAVLDAVPLPILRNVPRGVRLADQADLILLPQLTGASALRNTQGVPSVVIVHDIGIVDYPGDREGMNWLTYQSILQSFWGLRSATHVIAVSHFTRNRLIAHLPELAGRVSVVPNGVNTTFLHHRRTQEEARQRVAQHLGHAPGQPMILNVGTELPRKNISLLFQAFKRIRGCYPEAQLIKVGGPGQPQWRTRTLETARAPGLSVGQDLLILEDIVDDTLLADLYCAADVFISTSLYEGFGLPALEAMAVGTPVIVTNRGALPEVVGDGGWTVEADLDALVAAIDTALSESTWAERGQRGRDRAATFTWERAAEQYLEIMHKVGEKYHA